MKRKQEKNAEVKVWLTAEQKTKLTALADARGLSASAYIRQEVVRLIEASAAAA